MVENPANSPVEGTVVSPIIYDDLYTSQVVGRNFWTINSRKCNEICWSCFFGSGWGNNLQKGKGHFYIYKFTLGARGILEFWDHFQLGPSLLLSRWKFRQSPVAGRTWRWFSFFFWGRVRPNESCEGYVTNILAKQSCFANRNSVYIGCFVDGAFGSPVLVDHNKLHPVPPTTLGSLVATFPFPQILEMIADSITREQENKIQSIMTIPGPKYIYI